MSISVVIPTYNSRFLGETLKSILAQTLPPDEILVIDDGSTDNTAEFAESFGHPVRVIRRSNQRQAASRNFGVQEAKSDWVALVDHDDLWEPNKLELQVKAITAHPEADLCYTGRRLLEQVGDTFRLGRVIETPPASDLPTWLLKDTSFLVSSMLMRRSAFLASGGFDTHFKYSEDWDLWMRLLHSGCRFISCPEPLLLYRIHEANTSLKALAMLDEVRDIYLRHIQPHRPRLHRLLGDGLFWSRHEAEAAFALRRTGDPLCLRMMLTSIAHWPFGDLHRYKVAAHMLLSSLRTTTAHP